MPWFLVDDDFAFHPKADDAGDFAIGLWTRAGSYSAKYGRRGFISRTDLAKLRAKPAQIKALVAARLWVEVDGGYQFHQWDERQPSPEEVEQRKRKRAEAGRAGGLKSGQTRAERAAARTEAEASASPNDEAETKQMLRTGDEANANPGQARPIQTPLLTLVGRLAVGDARGASQPAELIPLWQELAGPSVDLEAEARRYLELYAGQPAANEHAAWTGFLRKGAARRAANAPAAPRHSCGRPDCTDGWLPDRDGRPNPCPTCKPHLARPHLRAVHA